jgi:hypothetical protein
MSPVCALDAAVGDLSISRPHSVVVTLRLDAKYRQIAWHCNKNFCFLIVHSGGPLT